MKDGTFTADRLLALYERVAEAEDAIHRLRRFVLDLAVRGKLVEQDLTDEPAAELLKRIAKEKARLVKAGEIRKRKDFSEIVEGPYILPKSWLWVRIGEIGETQTGSTPPKCNPEFYGSDIPFLRPGDLYPTHVDYSGEGLSHAGATASGRLASAGSILMVCIGTIGKCQVIDRDSSFNQQINALTPLPGLLPSFLLRAIQSDFFQAMAWDSSAKTTIAILNKGNWEKLPVPLPPLAEQHRIVAKVDELMALCDRLEAARARREAVRDRLTAATLTRLTAPETDTETFPVHARFALQTLPTLTTRPDQIKTLRQTILNLAVRGKLVEQEPTDEPASELLKRIVKEKAQEFRKFKKVSGIVEGPYSLPASWTWTRLGEIGKTQTGSTPPRSNPKFYGNDLPFLRPGDLYSTHVDYSGEGLSIAGASASGRLAPEGSILMVCIGTIGKCQLTNRPSSFNQQINALTPLAGLLPSYLLRAVQSDFFQTAAWDASARTTIAILNKGNWERLPIPLPPLAEQHRIVAKVDALMALCDQLEASLTTASTTRSRLLEATLHAAVAGGLSGGVTWGRRSIRQWQDDRPTQRRFRVIWIPAPQGSFAFSKL